MKKPYHTSIIGLISGLFFLFGACRTTTEQVANKYEKYLMQAYDRGQFNGNALVFEKGEVVFQGAFGISNIDPIDSLNLRSVFRLGSVSKQFTAMGIMLLQEQGKLSYDQDIRDFFPELPYHGITVRQLLQHVSGIPDYYWYIMDYWKPELQVTDPARYVSGNEEVIGMLANIKPAPNFQPLEKWEYSNTNYFLLASIVSRVSGLPFAEFMRTQVFEPAGMTNTVVYNYLAGPDTAMPGRVYGFQTAWNGQDRTLNDAHFLNRVHGDGGIYSTLEDLLKWDRIWYTDKLISPQTRETALSPAILSNGDTTSYGFGWFLEKTPTGKKAVSHTGGWVGFTTYIFRGMEEDNCIIILTNNSTKYIWGIIKGLKDLLYGQEASLPPLALGELMGKVIYQEGIDTALAQFRSLRADSPEDYRVDERELNLLGYELLGGGKVDEAIEIFRLTSETFPQSANAYDSLGDGYLARGDTTNALIHFKKALAQDPAFAWIEGKIKELEAR